MSHNAKELSFPTAHLYIFCIHPIVVLMWPCQVDCKKDHEGPCKSKRWYSWLLKSDNKSFAIWSNRWHGSKGACLALKWSNERKLEMWVCKDWWLWILTTMMIWSVWWFFKGPLSAGWEFPFGVCWICQSFEGWIWWALQVKVKLKLTMSWDSWQHIQQG